MKKLYARLVLWLIRPALELEESTNRVVITSTFVSARDEVTAEIRKALSRPS
ncbi:hypothetical protein [Cupriavidus pauculus]|uniref:hypothetical protein n=1 Tax=Cupriavidus pauculus TaxID=82633 RepID=UPI001D0C3CDE|nr:hypothetical protein [Cupriavidus pauculus]